MRVCVWPWRARAHARTHVHVRARAPQNRQETEKQTRLSKLKDMEVQEIRRRERMLEDARGLIPGLQTQLRDMNAELERMRLQRKQLEVQQKEINKDVDLLMDNVLAQEQASGSKSTELMEAIKRNREAVRERTCVSFAR